MLQEKYCRKLFIAGVCYSAFKKTGTIIIKNTKMLQFLTTDEFMLLAFNCDNCIVKFAIRYCKFRNMKDRLVFYQNIALIWYFENVNCLCN